jgi:hypothetical protein
VERKAPKGLPKWSTRKPFTDIFHVRHWFEPGLRAQLSHSQACWSDLVSSCDVFCVDQDTHVRGVGSNRDPI